eukprot:CAMPEP_0174850054 /NCGR_PEP_ID=MMETSP1114-20130205/18855_1 /TAXON_ID=312471 /ORGANISM="Neobodo designis, Strain CCAP 1951/1" /LENGTH=222 /DNA_ID=CAMNT_0016084479 /DNA_START=54 /DNA_END=722 /DNA_ORIENTATION=-
MRAWSVAKLVAIAAALCVFAAAPVAAVHGGDVSEPYSESHFQCAKRNGWEFVIVRSFLSYGEPDPNAPGTLDHAKAAGIPYRDVYHFPCKGKDPKEQVRRDIDAVGKHRFGTMWFDIETNPSPGCHWGGKDENCQFLHHMIEEGKAQGIKMGVYASPYMWSTIMGGCTAGADHGLPLWYATYDHSPSFAGFREFGGWKHPNMKQYWDSVGECGINADADWYP